MATREKADGTVSYYDTRVASLIECPRCGAEIWAGLTDTVLAFDARVNPYPITVEEAQFQLDNGRCIFYLDAALWLWDYTHVPDDDWRRRRLLAAHHCHGGRK